MYKNHTINGYTVININDKDDTIYITATILSGINHETKENLGIHHLLEHVLTEAWKPCGKDCTSFWDKKGVVMNASTHNSYVHFYVNGLKKDLQLMMDYIKDIITRPFFKESTLAIEKHAVLNELLILKNDPETQLYNAFNTEFFINEGLQLCSNYDVQIANLKKMNLQTLRDFFKQIHKEIIFVSNVDFPKFKDTEKETDTKKDTDTKKEKDTKKDTKKEKEWKTDMKDVFRYSTKIIHVPFKQKSTVLIMGMPLPHLKKYYKMSAALSILQMILFQELRVNMKMVYGITVSLNLNPNYLFIKTTMENKHVKTVYHKIVGSFQKYKKENFPKDYINGMKNKMRLGYQNTNQNGIFLVNHVLQEYMREGIISYEKKIADIEKITDFRPYMVEFKGLVAYQGPVKIF